MVLVVGWCRVDVGKVVVGRQAAAVAVELAAAVEVVAAFWEQAAVHEAAVVHVDAEGVEGSAAVDRPVEGTAP